HFLDMQTGRRAWKSELSSVDSAFLLAGMLTAAEYFTRATQEEREIRALARQLYERVDWKWMLIGRRRRRRRWTRKRRLERRRWCCCSGALRVALRGLG